MNELVAQLDAARRLSRDDPARLPACCAARDALFALAKQSRVATMEAFNAADALRRAGTSDGTRVAALALLVEVPGVPHLLLLCACACAAAPPHRDAPLFVTDVARTAFASALALGWFVPKDALASMATAVDAMPLPADGDDARRRAWRAQVLEKLRAALDCSGFGPMRPEAAPVPAWGPGAFATERNMRDALLGSVLWQALGDALGFLVEGRTAAEAAAYTRDVVRTGAVQRFALAAQHFNAALPRYVPLDGSGGAVAVAFGQYTDDTQCMRELLRSIAATGGVLHAGHYARRIARLFANAGLLTGHAPVPGGSAIVGYGASTRAATQAIADGGRDAWQRSGQDSPGNGGCMRAGPLGLLLPGSELVHAAALQCHVTHARTEAKAAAAAVAVAAECAARSVGVPLDARAFIASVAAAVREVHAGVADAVAALSGDLAAPSTDVARAAIVARGAACRDGMWHDGAVISSSAVQACLWALYAFLKRPDDPLEAICLAIEGGGDTDTTAAMAGAVAGARNGTRALPHHLVARLNDAGKHHASALASLVDELVPLIKSGRGIRCGPTVPRLYGRPGKCEDQVLATIAALRAGGPYPGRHDPDNEKSWELTLIGLFQGERGADVRGYTAALFAALAGNTTLRSLNLIGCELGDGGAAELADALRVNRTLETLFLRGCCIGDAGATALAGALRFNTSLRRLHLSDNRFGQNGEWALRDALGVNNMLQSLVSCDSTPGVYDLVLDIDREFRLK